MQPVALQQLSRIPVPPTQVFDIYIFHNWQVSKPNLWLNVPFVTAHRYKEPFYAPVQTESNMKTSLCQASVRAFVQLHKNSV